MIQQPRFLVPGDRLGKYELIRQIAVGGMAELYLGRTLGIEGFEKLVVLKRILPQFTSNAKLVQMFLSEARLAATLHHPNIAQVMDIGGEDNDYFFAMEYVHGEDLGRLMAAAAENGVPLSLDVALTFICGLCAGLHYAHEKVATDGKPLHVVHRDVSPSNVLISYDGAVKVVDFGIARVSSTYTGEKTHGGGLKGKIGFMSPEQCRGGASIDRRSDVYSVGAILFELTVGRQPFVGETEFQVLEQIVNHDAPSPSELVPGYSPELEKIVLRALARDPAQRYASALELQTDLEDFAHASRLRMSALVLARLMSSLFPARLEEWQHAHKQGAFFVEQEVVRTLIESGKTSDSAPRYTEIAGDDPLPDTSVGPPLALDDKPTEVVPLRLMEAETRSFSPPPVVSGTLVTAAMPARRDQVGDETALVRALPPPGSHADATSIVPHRTRSRRIEVALGVAVGLIALLVIIILTRPSGEQAPAPVTPVVTQPASPPPPPIAEAVKEVPAPPPVAEEPAPVEPPPVKVMVKPVVKPPAAKVVKPAPPPAKKPAPPQKKDSWNDDSPFMPVRN